MNIEVKHFVSISWIELAEGRVMRISSSMFKTGDRGSTVVKALCFKSEGRCFDSRWCHWNFSLT